MPSHVDDAAANVADEANEAIRAFVRAHGDRPWGEAESAELNRLRAVWLAAVRASVERAA